MFKIHQHRTDLSKGQVKQVIDDLIIELNQHLALNPSKKAEELYDTAILFSYRANKIKQAEREGTSSADNITTDWNKLALGLIEFLTELDSLKISKKKALIIKDNLLSSPTHNPEFDFDIFLCFSNKDIRRVKIIAQELRRHGFRVFAFHDSLSDQVGLPFLEKTQYALKTSQHFMLYSTPNAMTSNWVKHEYGAFLTEVMMKNPENRRFIIMKGRRFREEDIPIMLRGYQYADDVDMVLNSIRPTEQQANPAPQPSSEKQATKGFISSILLSNFKSNLLLTGITIAGFLLPFLSHLIFIIVGWLMMKGIFKPFSQVNSERNKWLGKTLIKINIWLFVMLIALIVISGQRY